MKNNMPVWNSYSNIAQVLKLMITIEKGPVICATSKENLRLSFFSSQRLRNYVANGNHIIFTGGSLVSMEFINTYFW
jgi:hypothetical protein